MVLRLHQHNIGYIHPGTGTLTLRAEHHSAQMSKLQMTA